MVFPSDFFPENKEIEYAFNIAEFTNRSLFLTGKAGTGKSTFLKNFCKFTKKKFLILAPTGIAALNVKGQTIHSFFGLPLRPLYPNDREITYYPKAKYDIHGNIEIDEHYKRKIIRKLEVVIIDEISMVRPDIIDAIDESLRKNGGIPYLPFGGKQIIFIGDLFQLEPVVTKNDLPILSKFYKSTFFFNARVMQGLDYSLVTLKKVYRQKNKRFISLLNSIRNKTAEYEDFEELNECYVPGYESNKSEYFIFLCATNNVVEQLNDKYLKEIKGEILSFEGRVDGEFEAKLPAPMYLNLKINAQVMFVKNDMKGRWVNGTIGKVSDLSSKSITVRILEEGIEKEVLVEPTVWERVVYKWNEEKNEIEQEITGSYFQFPIKLAWAVTIHKSQGLTFDQVILDPGRGMFAHGQLYVALSRCTSLEGLILVKPIRMRDMIVDPTILELEENDNSFSDLDFQLENGYEERLNYLIEKQTKWPNDQSIRKQLNDVKIKINELV